MAALVIPNAVMLKLNWSAGTRSWQNVLGLIKLGGNAPIDQALADSLFASAVTAFTNSGLAATMSPNVNLVSVSVRDISTANFAEFTSVGTAQPGTGTDDMLPLNVAAVATLRTASAGKSFRGRVYFSGFTEAENDALGRTSTTVNQNVVGFLNQLNAATTAASLALAVLSRPRDAVTIPAKVISAKAGFPTRVTAVETRNTKWESQRRRTGRT